MIEHGPFFYETEFGPLYLDQSNLPDSVLDRLVEAIVHGGLDHRFILRATPIGETRGWTFEVLSRDEFGRVRWNGDDVAVDKIEVIPL